jgi:alpha-1,3-rhamnosyl/mannosyltransferase
MRPGNTRSDGRHLEPLGLRSGYFLHVGTLEPRKNLALLVRAWSRLDPALRASHPLVLAGGKGWGDEELQETLRKAPDGIRNLGYVDEAAIPALYRGALALVMPSHYEGYGMPVIEMRAVGGAVITSLDPAVREVAGPDTPGVDALDESGWANSLRRAVEDPRWLEAQRQNGPAWASRHTWAHGAQAVVRAAHVALAGAGVSASRVAA